MFTVHSICANNMFKAFEGFLEDLKEHGVVYSILIPAESVGFFLRNDLSGIATNRSHRDSNPENKGAWHSEDFSKLHGHVQSEQK